MEQVFTINRRALMVILLFVTLTTGQANSDNVKKVGDTLVLRPGSVDAAITSVTWKHNSNLAVEWYGDKTDFYPKFKGRCELNTKTGELTFLSVTLGDSGSYTPEINNRVLKPTEIEVISGVSTPTVSKSCDATQCVFTCEGITTDAGSVTYSWWSGDVMRSETKELIITKEDKETSFFCKMKNPVSSESSEEVLNPFITSSPDPENNNNGLYGLFVLPVVVLIVVAGVFIYKHITGEYPSLLLRVLSFFETFPCCHTDSSQPSPKPVPEMKPLINGDKGVVQGSSNVETIDETETTSETTANQGPAAESQTSPSSSDVQVTPPQDQKTESTKTNNDPETTPENEEATAESPTISPSGTSDQPGTTSEKSEDTEAADPPPSSPSSGTSDQSETPETQENQSPPAKPPRISSSSDNVTPLQDQQTDESTKTNNDPETSSEKPVVDESSADLEKTTVTPNSEALNPNMEETQANKD